MLLVGVGHMERYISSAPTAMWTPEALGALLGASVNQPPGDAEQRRAILSLGVVVEPARMEIHIVLHGLNHIMAGEPPEISWEVDGIHVAHRPSDGEALPIQLWEGQLHVI
mmetsp:Transcript_7647/g.14481  ORF Transcript_7647/g.14481 Transcript_7647/m.14481 type:complete len:111 (+) Transcript_7647:29-361(+)